MVSYVSSWLQTCTFPLQNLEDTFPNNQFRVMLGECYQGQMPGGCCDRVSLEIKYTVTIWAQ